jgi:hypothetical protein
MNAVQAALSQPASDRIPRQSNRGSLPMGHNPVLAGRNTCKPRIRVCVHLFPAGGTGVTHTPSVPGGG